MQLKCIRHRERYVRFRQFGLSGLLALALSAGLNSLAQAHDDKPGNTPSSGANGPAPIRADGHAPIGVMGDHMHHKRKVMLSYRYMHMDMSGNRIGTNDVSPQTIVTTVPNRFFGKPGQPPTLRIAPTEMSMDMHMFGAMYAPTDWVTLMAMVNYVDKEMDHLTFMGGAGTTVRGTFTTRSSGIGDMKVSGLFKIFENQTHHFHANLGLSLPTGSITEAGRILTPMGATPTVRLPYAMQLGSGTVDLLAGLTYTGRHEDFSWGAQYRTDIRLESRNSQGYRLGNMHGLTGWLAYQWAPWISTSVRLDGTSTGRIKGIDPAIAGPVQTANPNNYGGERADLFFGLNLVGQSGALRGHRLAIEGGFPIYQNLNGPQMKTDFQLTIGWQKAL